MAVRAILPWIMATAIAVVACFTFIRFSETLCVRTWRNHKKEFAATLDLDADAAVQRLASSGFIRIKDGDDYRMFYFGNMVPDPVEAIVYSKTGFPTVRDHELAGADLELHEWKHLEDGWYYCAYDVR